MSADKTTWQPNNKVNNEETVNVIYFKYLGSITNNSGQGTKEIKSILVTEIQWLNSIKFLWHNTNKPLKVTLL